MTRWDLLSLAAQGAGVVLLVGPMRAANGYRGLHEILSGTRVVLLIPGTTIGPEFFLPMAKRLRRDGYDPIIWAPPDLFTDSLAWLTGLGERISFMPQAYGVGVPLIFVSAQTFNLITFLTVILLPGAVLVAGVAIWMRRARR